MTDAAQHTPVADWRVIEVENKYHAGTHHEGNKTIVTVATVVCGDEVIARCGSLFHARFIAAAPETAAERDRLKEQLIRIRDIILLNDEAGEAVAWARGLSLTIKGVSEYDRKNAFPDYDPELKATNAKLLDTIKHAEKYLTASGADKYDNYDPEKQILDSFRAAIAEAEGKKS